MVKCDMDTITIFLMIFIGNFISAMLCYTYIKRHSSKVLRFHFFSQIAFTVAFAMFVFEEYMDIDIFMLTANLFILIGCTYGIFAITLLIGNYTREIKRNILVYVVFIGIVHVGMTLFSENSNLRVVVSTAGLSILWIYAAYLLLRQKNKSLLQSLVGMVSVMIVLSLFVRIRHAMDFSVNFMFYDYGLGHTAIFISYYAFMILSGSSILLLEKEKDDEQIRFFATRDELTGLYNRRYFFQEVEKALSLSYRKEMPFSVLMLDIDYFKKINDTFGHQKGDLVLKDFAGILRDELRQHDIIGRIGGEEFLVFLYGLGSGEAYAAAERLRCMVARHDSEGVRFTTSIGIYSAGCSDRDAKSFDEIYHQCDLALYEAKNTGRNRIVQKTSQDTPV